MPRKQRKYYSQGWAKLDTYNYTVKEVSGDTIVYVDVSGPTDVVISDIATDINASDNHVYLEGQYYLHIDSTVERYYGEWKMIIFLKQLKLGGLDNE